MPNVNNIFRKGKVKKLNLEKFEVFLEEETSLGPLVASQYFNISRFPTVLPGGNSYFEIEGSKLLKPEVELKTELLDSAGQPIFHYALPKSPKARKLKVTMQVTSNVVNGVGRLIIMGELNPNLIDVPEDFRDTYNVRLTGLVDINTTLPNVESIEFFKPPRMTVAEQVKGEIELPGDVEIMFVTKTGTATMTGDGIGFTAVADAGVGDTSVGTNTNQGDDKFEEFDATDSDVGDFEDFEEPDVVGVGEEKLPDFISVPVINKVKIKSQDIEVDDTDEEEESPKVKTERAGNAARKQQELVTTTDNKVEEF